MSDITLGEKASLETKMMVCEDLLEKEKEYFADKVSEQSRYNLSDNELQRYTKKLEIIGFLLMGIQEYLEFPELSEEDDE